MKVRHLHHVPTSEPAGMVTAHNNHRAKGLGNSGFRAWFTDDVDSPFLEPCGCGWAPMLDRHFLLVARPARQRINAR